MRFKEFECKFEPLERDSKHSNAYSSHWTTILLQIWSKFEAFEWDSKNSNANSNHSKQIRSIRMQIQTSRKGFESKFEPFERDSKHSNANSNHSKGIHSIWMQIRASKKESLSNGLNLHSNASID